MFIDSGPVVAFLNRNDEWHGWVREQFKWFSEFTTCDAVLAEVCARLHYEGLDQWKALDLLAEGARFWILIWAHTGTRGLANEKVFRPADGSGGRLPCCHGRGDA